MNMHPHQDTEPEMDEDEGSSGSGENNGQLSENNIIQLTQDNVNRYFQEEEFTEPTNEQLLELTSPAAVVEQQEVKPVTPLPKLAMAMISIIIIAEAVGYSILYPVVPFMVRDFLLFEQQEAHHFTNGTYTYNVSSIGSGGIGGGGGNGFGSFYNNNFSILPKSYTYARQFNFDLRYSNDSIFRNGTFNSEELEIPEERVGLLVGVLASSYSIAQLISNWFICRSSDHLGRKPFLLSGLIVNVIFLGLFSFSKNFWYALVVRSVHGMLNANVPIYKSFVVDVTDDTNQEKAFVFISILWAISNVVSPGMGGWLSKPAEKWPFLFGGKDTGLYNFFYSNPYVLPLSLPIIMNVISIICTIFMRESIKNRFDIVHWIRLKVGLGKRQIMEEERDASIEMMSASMTSLDAFSTKDNLLEEDSVDETSSIEITKISNKEEKPNMSLFHLLKDSLVVRVALLYLFLGLATNIMDEMVPIFASNSLEKRGLGLDSSQIGLMLSIGGITSLVMLIIYPILSNKLGFLWLYRVALIIYIIDVTVFPFTSELIRYEIDSWVVFTFATFCIFIKACAQEMAYTSQFLLVNNSAPSPEHIGSTTGLAHITASVGWASGPFIGGMLLSVGLNWADSISESNPNSFFGKIPLVDKISFWVCAGVCVFTFMLSLTVPKSILNRRYEKAVVVALEETKSV